METALTSCTECGADVQGIKNYARDVTAQGGARSRRYRLVS
jgi:hypothetical protein